MNEIRASILIPTFHADTTLGITVRSALRQTVAELEVIILGDGVDQATRLVAEELAASDARVRFLDLPKGENRGELHRDLGVREARSDAIVYLGHDDILLPRHVENVINLLVDHDLVQSRNCYIMPDETLHLFPTDLSDPRCIAWHLEDPPRNCVSITGTAHTRSSYLELESGWTVTPAGIWTDLYMWRKFFRQPGFRGATHQEITTVQFPSVFHRDRDPAEASRSMAQWEQFSLAPDVDERIAVMLADTERRSLIDLTIHRSALVREVRALASRETEMTQQLAQLRDDVRALELRERASSEATAQAFRSSTSWRVTAPLRAVGTALHRLGRRSRTPASPA